MGRGGAEFQGKGGERRAQHVYQNAGGSIERLLKRSTRGQGQVCEEGGVSRVSKPKKMREREGKMRRREAV
jgi:hypothetical protein